MESMFTIKRFTWHQTGTVRVFGTILTCFGMFDVPQLLLPCEKAKFVESLDSKATEAVHQQPLVPL